MNETNQQEDAGLLEPAPAAPDSPEMTLSSPGSGLPSMRMPFAATQSGIETAQSA